MSSNNNNDTDNQKFDAYLHTFIPQCTQFKIIGNGNCFFACILHQLIPLKKKPDMIMTDDADDDDDDNDVNDNLDLNSYTQIQTESFKSLFLDWIVDSICSDFFTPQQLLDFFPSANLDKLAELEIPELYTEDEKNEIKSTITAAEEKINKKNILLYIKRNRVSSVYADAIIIHLLAVFLQIDIQIIRLPRKQNGYDIYNPSVKYNSIPILDYIEKVSKKYDDVIAIIKQIDFSLNQKRHLLICHAYNHYNSIIPNFSDLSILNLQQIFAIYPFGLARHVKVKTRSSPARYKKHHMNKEAIVLTHSEYKKVNLLLNNANDVDDTYVKESKYPELKYSHLKHFISNNGFIDPCIVNYHINNMQAALSRICKEDTPRTLIFPSNFYSMLSDEKLFSQTIEISKQVMKKSVCPYSTSIFQYDQICFPIYDSEHNFWTLAYLDLKTQAMCYYSPIQPQYNVMEENSEEHRKLQVVSTDILYWIQAMWEHIYAKVIHLYKIDLPKFVPDDWKVIQKDSNIPFDKSYNNNIRNNNSGVFILGYIESILYSSEQEIQFKWNNDDIRLMKYKISTSFL
jgi:hypothetical protein